MPTMMRYHWGKLPPSQLRILWGTQDLGGQGESGCGTTTSVSSVMPVKSSGLQV